MDLSILIVNWNSKDYLRQCARSLFETIRDLEFEIVVVDGASYDGCGEMLAAEFPSVKFIQADKNLGFARANNLAFEHSTGRFLLFLNPDTEVQSNAVRVLYDALNDRKDAGGVCPKLLNTDGTLQSTVYAVPTIFNQAFNARALGRFRSGAQIFATATSPAEITVLPGACIMSRREVFEQVGLFTRDYFMYCEDVDLSCKFRGAGYRNYYIPSAVVVHHAGGSSTRAVSKFSAVMMSESIWLFLKKTRGEFYGLAYRATMMLTALVRLLVLALCLPIRAVRGGKAPVLNSLGKWKAILSWSLGGETWTKRYEVN